MSVGVVLRQRHGELEEWTSGVSASRMPHVLLFNMESVKCSEFRLRQDV